MLQFITWTVRPEIFAIENLHLSPSWLLLLAIAFFGWGIADIISSRKALNKWKAAGSKPNNKPESTAIFQWILFAIGTYLIYRANSPQGMDIGPIAMRWYGLMFLIGFIAGYRIVSNEFRHEGAPQAWLPTLLIYIATATIIGARLGHCLFYEWDYYSTHPTKIIAFWEGGLASHGGTIGIIIAIFIFSRKVNHRSPLWTFDRIVAAVALVACLIRLGNLFNSEIFGHATTLPWGFKYPLSHEWQHLYAPTNAACHPTQLYEAITYLLLSALLAWMYWKKNAQERPGLLLGVFFIGVFLPRILIEFVKNPQEEFERTMLLNMGQLLSVPFVLAGILLIYRAMTHPRTPLNYPNKFPDDEKCNN